MAQSLSEAKEALTGRQPELWAVKSSGWYPRPCKAVEWRHQPDPFKNRRCYFINILWIRQQLIGRF